MSEPSVQPTRKCCRTLITIEVLAVDEPYVFKGFEELAHDAVYGDVSGTVLTEQAEVVDRTTFEHLCEGQGSDADFFFCGADPETFGLLESEKTYPI